MILIRSCANNGSDNDDINPDIRSLVIKYLSTIKQDLTSQNHSLDLSLIDNIKNSYDLIKRHKILWTMIGTTFK